MSLKVLELGCGNSKTPGAFGVDMNPRSAADLVHNLDVFPYPLEDNAFDKVICKDVLEHVADFVKTLEEVWRVAKPGAIIDVSGPFMSSVNYFSDPTHRRAFTSRSFDYFIPGTDAFAYGYSLAQFRLISVEYDKFDREKRRWHHRWLLERANRNKKTYEDRYAFIYPVFQIYFELEVVK
jgi:ubiquinone/menaquinone biosynthesis C-methylase UbiE